jgi:hypothetical protein
MAKESSMPNTPNPDQIKSQITNTLPALPQAEVSHFVDKAAQLDNGTMTREELLNLLIADPQIAHLFSEMERQIQHGGTSLGANNTIGQMGDAVGGNKIEGDSVTGDKIDASGAQGTIANANGPIIQNFYNGSFDAKLLIDLIRGTPAPAPPAEPRDPTIDRYKQQFAAALESLPAPGKKYDFPLTFRDVSSNSVPDESSVGIPIEQLITQVQASPLIILRGAAGSGKSTAMQRMAEVIVKNNFASILPIYIELRRLKPDALQSLSDDLEDDADPEQYLEPLLGASIVLLNTAKLKGLVDHVRSLQSGMLLVIVDGLNEIYGEEAADSILKRLTTYITGCDVGAGVLVTDRITPRDAINQQWKVAQIERLTLEVVLEQFRAKQIDAIYGQLTDNDRTLLQTPYFLDYALTHNTSRLSSASEAIATFFEELGFADDTLDRMAKAAFDAYKKQCGSKFDVQQFEQVVKPETFRRLLDEGVVIVLSDEEDAQSVAAEAAPQAQFDHPLKHDYLAARYLAQNTTEWTPESLDVVSFDSNSFDALAMTLELLQNEAQCDTFIQRVHNWNWAAALVCIAKAMRTGSGRHSQKIQFAVLAIVAEKLFDQVQQTRVRASEVLALFPEAIAAPYKQVRSLGELYTLVQQQVQSEARYQDSETWFANWRDLFVRFDSPTFGEPDLKQIVSTQAIIGWTAANVFRRFKLSDVDVRQLRAYYDACRACDFHDWRASTIRSRVVHALGATDTRPVVDLLFNALNQDTYLWARIGAARSLVEIAALTTDAELRRFVIDTLMQMVNDAESKTLAIKTLREIGQSAFYCDAHAGWHAAVTPLITLVRDRQSEPEKASWSTLLIEFEKFCQEPTMRAVGDDATTLAPTPV